MADHDAFMRLVQAVVAGEAKTVSGLLAASPELAQTCLAQGATRDRAADFFIDAINHYLYAGDTALHAAAAAHHEAITRKLLASGADVRAKNRRGAQPIHYAADGVPGSRAWDPAGQGATVAALIAAGADPNALDKSGVAPLHRAARTRCAAAVKALLDGGADIELRNKNGSTAIMLANRNTGRGGSGAPEAKAQQAEVVRLLEQRGASR